MLTDTISKDCIASPALHAQGLESLHQGVHQHAGSNKDQQNRDNQSVNTTLIQPDSKFEGSIVTGTPFRITSLKLYFSIIFNQTVKNGEKCIIETQWNNAFGKEDEHYFYWNKEKNLYERMVE